MKNAAIVISCILLVVAVGQTDVHGAILLVPDMTLDAQTNVYGSGITPLVPVTFQVQENHASSDSLSVRAIGQIDLAVSWANYDVNAAGIFFHSAQPVIAGTTGYHYGEVLIGNASLGYHSLFPADATVGRGTTPVPTDISVVRPLNEIFGAGFTGLSSGTELGLVIYDSDESDNSGQFQISSGAVPEPSTLAIWGVLGGLGLIAARQRRKRVA